MKSFFHKVEEYYLKHERHFSTASFIGGFIFDNLTLTRIDVFIDDLIIIIYLAISGACIAFLNRHHEHGGEEHHSRLREYLPIFMQFSFGGLFSSFFIFYTRSAAISSSWPFLLILLSLLVGNEFFKNYYERLVFQTSIYFVAVFSFAIFYVPVLTKSLGVGTFLLAGVVSLFIIFLFARTLFRVAPRRFVDSRKRLRVSIIIIYILMNVLYFTNLIPPIPLSLKDSGIYYSVERISNGYSAVGEKGSWYESLPFIAKTIKLHDGEALYAFSSVFAPTDLNTKIVHDWQYYDEGRGEWVSVSKVGFNIFGGRDGGYRGFSIKENVFPGKWRVDVETERGQIIGRIRFDVDITGGVIATKTLTL